MKVGIKQLLDNYISWLKEETTFSKIGDFYEITTPFLDSSNDYIQIYVKQEGDDLYFSDDSATINMLEMKGMNLSPQRFAHLKNIINQYNVKLEGTELTMKAPVQNFAQCKHMFIQTLLRVEDLLYTAKQKVASLFLEDVQEFFAEQDIYCTENVQFSGISGFSHTYDFLLQRNKRYPERLCQTINNPSKSAMENILFVWSDTKPARRADSRLIVILNDTGNTIGKGVEAGFRNYGVDVIKWGERNLSDNLLLLN